ncbi:MAG: hypothetical protein GY898_23380 [Proteobacteria bacterium]|nr:hypothetical protein [Pseudomonadota bacterium]
MSTFADLLKCDPIDMDTVAAHLDALPHDERVKQVRRVGGGLQRKLFAAAQGFKALDHAYYVPEATDDKTFVRHYGKNSLPLFSIFEKRFARPEPESPVMWGYNHSSMMPLVGPGHFVLRTGPGDGEMHVDYYSTPPERLDGAPKLKANDSGISTLVYGHMIDVMRGVSDHVSIGRAVKKGARTANYFLLCREGAA